MTSITRVLKKIIPVMPLWSAQITYPPDYSVTKLKIGADAPSAKSTVVYFPSCISRMLGTYEGKEKNIMETFMSICSKSSIDVVLIGDVRGRCCSQIFSSKGFNDACRFTANDIVNRLWKTSREGSLPVVIDVSSCAYTLHNIRSLLNEGNKNRYDQLTIFDSVDFLHDMVMPTAIVKERKSNIVLHPVCSLEKMKTGNKFIKLAKQFADDVTVPRYAGCCGMAGDRGFLFPELTASATFLEAQEVNAADYSGYYSSTKTCEMAMSAAVRKNYESILYLVDELL